MEVYLSKQMDMRGNREVTIARIYFLYDCHKDPISDRQSPSLLILGKNEGISY